MVKPRNHTGVVVASPVRSPRPLLKKMGTTERGAVWEHTVARQLEAVCGVTAVLGSQARRGGQDEADVTCAWIHGECKFEKRVNLRAALRQAIDDASPGMMPVVFVLEAPDPDALGSGGDLPPFVIVRLRDFYALVGEFYRALGPRAATWRPDMAHVPNPYQLDVSAVAAGGAAAGGGEGDFEA